MQALGAEVDAVTGVSPPASGPPSSSAPPVGPDAPALEAARTLFMDHDGSAFHMERNDVLDRFTAASVPPEVQASWTRELLAERLAALDRPGNWRTVDTVLRHRALDELPALLAAEPRGRLWECCAFLELLLQVLDRCASPSTPAPEAPRRTRAELRTALLTVVERAWALTTRSRSDATAARIGSIIAGARARLDVLDTPGAPSAWEWHATSRTATPPEPRGPGGR